MLLTTLIVIVAQAGKGGEEWGAGCIIGMICCCVGVPLLGLLPMMIGAWKTFTKAGQPGIAAFIPIWQNIVLCKIAGKEDNRWFMHLIPVVGIIFIIQDYMDFAKAFGKEGGFGLGLVFLAPIFWPILGFGSAEYVGAPGGGAAGGGRRRAARYEDEEEEDEPPPRRKRRYEDDE